MSTEQPGTGDTAGSVPSDSRGWAVAAQLVPLLGLSFIGPLVIWLIKREEDPFVEVHAREALNFQISVLIYGIVMAITIIGIVLLIPLAIFVFVAAVVAAVRAANGEAFRYPLTIRLIAP